MCLSLLLIVMDNTIVNVALPTLQRDLGASTSQLQWVVDSYILVFAGLLLTMGSLGDRFGRRGALAIGLTIMGTASVASAFATDASHLIATRAIMGIGAALIMPATLSIITNVFTDRRERAQAIAMWSATAGVAVAIGPVTGGWLLEHFWWGSVFLVNVPVVVVALVLGQLFVPTSRDPGAPPVDLPRCRPVDRRARRPRVGDHRGRPRLDRPAGPRGLRRRRRAAGGVHPVGAPHADAHARHELLPQPPVQRGQRGPHAHVLRHDGLAVPADPVPAVGARATRRSRPGVRLLPMAAVQMVVAPLSAKVVERIGSKVVVTAGLLIAGAGLLLASRLKADARYGQVVVSLIVLAAGLALVMPPATESIMGSLPPAKAGVGSAVNDTTREVGAALGVAVLGSVMSSTYRPRVSEAIAGLPRARRDAARHHRPDRRGHGGRRRARRCARPGCWPTSPRPGSPTAWAGVHHRRGRSAGRRRPRPPCTSRPGPTTTRTATVCPARPRTPRRRAGRRSGRSGRSRQRPRRRDAGNGAHRRRPDVARSDRPTAPRSGAVAEHDRAPGGDDRPARGGPSAGPGVPATPGPTRRSWRPPWPCWPTGAGRVHRRRGGQPGGVRQGDVYRRWPSRAALLLDTAHRLGLEPPVVDTGSLRGDLVEMLTELAHKMRDTPAGAILPGVMAEASVEPGMRERCSPVHRGPATAAARDPAAGRRPGRAAPRHRRRADARPARRHGHVPRADRRQPTRRRRVHRPPGRPVARHLRRLDARPTAVSRAGGGGPRPRRGPGGPA